MEIQLSREYPACGSNSPGWCCAYFSSSAYLSSSMHALFVGLVDKPFDIYSILTIVSFAGLRVRNSLL